jgi:LysR family nitrogen assimilation transcriptional regulator
MDLRQIQYFVALYEEKSITKSARRLHVVQPAVSMQIRRIEVEYGMPLFERTTSGVFPNELASAIYPICLDVLAKCETIRQTLRKGSGKLSGNLSIGVPPSIAHGLLADVLINFQSNYPEVRIAATEGYSAHLVEWLLQGDLDFAILGEFEDDRRLYSQPIATEELVVVTAIETEVDGGTICGNDLLRLKVALPSAKNLIRILIDAEFEKASVALIPALEIDSLSTVFATVLRPGWATVLPRSAVRDSDLEAGLRVLRLVDPVIRRTLVATFPTLRPSSATAQQFIRELRDSILRVGGEEANIIRSDNAHQNNLIDGR